MNQSQLGALSRKQTLTVYAKIAPTWPGLTARQKPIGLKAVAAAVIWHRKPEPESDLRKADLGTLMRLSRLMAKSLETRK